MFRGNNTKKIDAIKFDSYGCLVEPFTFNDGEVSINTNTDAIPRLFANKTSFERNLAENFAVVKVSDSGSIQILRNLMKNAFFEAVLLNFHSGIDLSLQYTREILSLLSESLQDSETDKIVCILLKREVAKMPLKVQRKLNELSNLGALIIVGVTNTALVQKVSMVLGSPKEFRSKEKIKFALLHNIARENSKLLAVTSHKPEVELYRLAHAISKKIESLNEQQKTEEMSKLEHWLISSERQNLIFWFRKFGVSYTTALPTKPCALSSAIIDGKSVEFIAFLLSHMIDFETENRWFGNSVFVALKQRRKDIVRLFIEHKLVALAPSELADEFFAE